MYLFIGGSAELLWKHLIGAFPRAHPRTDLMQIQHFLKAKVKQKKKTKKKKKSLKSHVSLKDDVSGVHHVVDFRLCEWFNISYMQICCCG